MLSQANFGFLSDFWCYVATAHIGPCVYVTLLWNHLSLADFDQKPCTIHHYFLKFKADLRVIFVISDLVISLLVLLQPSYSNGMCFGAITAQYYFMMDL